MKPRALYNPQSANTEASQGMTLFFRREDGRFFTFEEWGGGVGMGSFASSMIRVSGPVGWTEIFPKRSGISVDTKQGKMFFP